MILIYKKQKREDSVQEEREGTKSGKELQTWKARLKSLVPILDWLIWTPTTIGMICKLFFNQFFAMFLLQIKLLLKGNVLRPRLEENVFVLNLEWNKNVYFLNASSSSCDYMFSNWSTRRFVFPFLISRRVLYLSLPCLTFSWWSRSFWVTLDSSLFSASSWLSICKQK